MSASFYSWLSHSCLPYTKKFNLITLKSSSQSTSGLETGVCLRPIFHVNTRTHTSEWKNACALQICRGTCSSTLIIPIGCNLRKTFEKFKRKAANCCFNEAPSGRTLFMTLPAHCFHSQATRITAKLFYNAHCSDAGSRSARAPSFRCSIHHCCYPRCEEKKEKLIQTNGNFVAGQQSGFSSQNQNKGF